MGINAGLKLPQKMAESPEVKKNAVFSNRCENVWHTLLMRVIFTIAN
jgi:hypothetical protein